MIISAYHIEVGCEQTHVSIWFERTKLCRIHLHFLFHLPKTKYIIHLSPIVFHNPDLIMINNVFWIFEKNFRQVNVGFRTICCITVMIITQYLILNVCKHVHHSLNMTKHFIIHLQILFRLQKTNYEIKMSPSIVHHPSSIMITSMFWISPLKFSL